MTRHRSVVLAFDFDPKTERRRDALIARTPLVIYHRDARDGHYGLARLATIRDYLTVSRWPADYSLARVIDDPEDLAAIKAAEVAIRDARRFADKVYARAYTRGKAIDPEAAEKARVE